MKEIETQELLDRLKKLESEAEIANLEQMARKISLNSLYGILANKHFLFYDPRMGESVTMTGQFVIRWAGERMRQYFEKISGDCNSLQYIDTDSISMLVGSVVEKHCNGMTTSEIVDFIDGMAKGPISKKLDQINQEIYDYVNAADHTMHLKRENIADKAFWVSKKRYAMHVHDSEGERFVQPKLKIMGLEMVKTSTPDFTRAELEKCLPIIFTQNEAALIRHIENVRTAYDSLPIDQIAFPRGISSITGYTDRQWNINTSKAIPIHVRGAISHNRLITTLELSHKYQMIQNGDKIKFVYLNRANPTRCHVISFIGTLPPEFELEAYVDRKEQFEKTFLAPIRAICDSIGWKTDNSISLEDFFS